MYKRIIVSRVPLAPCPEFGPSIVCHVKWGVPGRSTTQSVSEGLPVRQETGDRTMKFTILITASLLLAYCKAEQCKMTSPNIFPLNLQVDNRALLWEGII